MEPFLIAMTTSFRDKPTIHRSVESLRSVGVHEKIHLFAEPDSETSRDAMVATHWNEHRLGSFANHYQALTWGRRNLFNREQWLMLLEDDVIFRPDFCKLAFDMMEHTNGLIVGLTHEWTIKEHHPYLKDQRGWCAFDIRNGLNNVHGGQCYLIHSRMLDRILNSAHMKDSVVRAGAGENLYYTDNILVASAFPGPVFVHIPSLCQHIGDESYFFQPDDPNDPLKDRRGYLFAEPTQDSPMH